MIVWTMALGVLLGVVLGELASVFQQTKLDLSDLEEDINRMLAKFNRNPDR